MPDSKVVTLEQEVEAYVDRLISIEHEMELLREERKALNEEYEDRLDVKTLQHAIRIKKAEDKVKNKTTYDLYRGFLN